MKYNGKDNFITDNDILVTSGVGSNKNLHTVITEQQDDIDELKSNVKWIYKYGGVGSGSGSGYGSGSGGKWKPTIQIGGILAETGVPVDLSNKIIDNVALVDINIAISNPGAGGYQFKISYSYDDGTYQSYPELLTTTNNCSCTFTLKLTKNSKFGLKIQDIDNNSKDYIFTYFLFGLSYSIKAMAYNAQGKLYELPDTNYKPKSYPNGVVYRLEINNFGGFNLNYNVGNTIDYKIISINEQDYKLYNNNPNKGPYYDETNHKGMIDKSQVSIKLDYLIDNKVLSNELNFGTQTFFANIINILNGVADNHTISSEYSIVPDTNEYIICLSTSINGKIYNDNTGITDEEANKEAFYAGDKVTFNLRPFNFPTETIQVNYVLINQKNGINISSTLNLNAGRYTSASFNIYTGWTKIIINKTITKWYYGKSVQSTINWYNEEGDKQSKASNLISSYVRFNNSISDNMVSNSIFKSIKINNYYELTKNINAQDKIIDLYGTSTSFDINTCMHIALGVQFSSSNVNEKILELKNSNHQTMFTLYQSKCVFTNGGDAKIYIPKEKQYAPQDFAKYHLIDIYIKPADPYILTNTVEGNKSQDSLYYIQDLKDKITTENNTNHNNELYYAEIYIDGITDGITTTFTSSYSELRYLYLKNINISYNLIELSKFNSLRYTFNDIDAVLYYYTYKQLLSKNTSITQNNINMISNILSYDYNSISCDLSNKCIVRKHNQLRITKEFIDTISKYIEIPIYIINVSHTRENDSTTSIFQWLNGSYDENVNIQSWPIKSSNIDGVHSTGITYISPTDHSSTVIKFPNKDEYTQAIFTLDIQGSSTRRNHGKNLDLNLVNNNTTTGTKLLYSPNFDSADDNTFLPESKFTLKADIVDSGHTNNTVMGKFINDNTKKFETNSKGMYKNYIKNCLEGFPCIVILNIDYEVDNSVPEYYFLGIYNFNLGRGSYSNLGYVDNSIFDSKLESVSPEKPFEFFAIQETSYELRTDFGCAEITGNSPQFDFSLWDDTILYNFEEESGNNYMWDDIVTSQQGAFKEALKYFVRDVAISGGYIFKYLGKEAIDHSEWTGWNKVGCVPNVKKQYKRRSSDLKNIYYDPNIKIPNDEKWQSIFERTMRDSEYQGSQSYARLDYVSLVEYYTICMAFGLVDSVQKNLNVKTWTLNKKERLETDVEEKNLIRSRFYISFYDMDTCLGINNDSQDTTTFCFSDYWKSNETVKNDIHILQSITQYRDYFNDTDKELGEYGYDTPSSFLFAIAKYGTTVFNQSELDHISYLEYQTPTLVWLKYRAANATAYTGNNKEGTGSLRSADYFMNTYYKKHLEGVPELIFNLNYKAKYIVYNIEESWEFDESKKSTFIGTYTINPKTIYTQGFHINATKFRGRSIYRVTDWFDARLHILDAYFNLQDAREYISVTEEEKELQPKPKKNNNNVEVTQLSIKNNSEVSRAFQDVLTYATDINIKTQIFGNGSESPKITFPPEPITILVQAQDYTPLLFDVSGTIKAKYLLRSAGNKYQITFQSSGNTDFAFYGSNQLTYISDVTWFTPSSLYIISDNLRNIYGNRPNYKVKIASIKSPVLQSIELMGTNYSGTLELTNPTEYINLSTIDISNSQINLKLTDLTVQDVNLTSVYCSKCMITNCNNIKTLKLNDLTVTNELSLTINYSNEILLNEIEPKNFSITNNLSKVKGKDNILIIDGRKNHKFQTLETLTIHGFSKVYIFGCPMLNKVSISEINSLSINSDGFDPNIYLEEFVVCNCSTSNLVSTFTINSNDLNVIDLHEFSHLKRVCFDRTQNFTSVILPSTLTLQGSEFSGCKSLQYLDIRDKNNVKSPAITISNYNTYSFSYRGTSSGNTGFNTYTAESEGIFYRCIKFKLERTKTDNSITPLRVSTSVTSLSNLFNAVEYKTAYDITLGKIANFIDNIPVNNNITNISYMCNNQLGIKLLKDTFKSDGPNKSTLHLGTFGKCTNVSHAFTIDDPYINKWIWYDKNKTQVIGCNDYYTLFGQGSKNIYITIDCFYPILTKITKFIGSDCIWLMVIHPIYSGANQTFNINTILTDDKKKQEKEYENASKYSKSITYVSDSTNAGNIISGTVYARSIFVNETNSNGNVDTEDNVSAIYPTSLTDFSGVNLCSTTGLTWNLYGLFSKKWKIQYISAFQYNCNIREHAIEYEDILNNKFLPSTLININNSFNTGFSTRVDYSRFLDFKQLLTQYEKWYNDKDNKNKRDYQFFGSCQSNNMTDTTYLAGMTFDKTISKGNFYEWLCRVIESSCLKCINFLFKNTNIIISKDATDVNFTIDKAFESIGYNSSQRKKILDNANNNQLVNIYGLFQNLRCYKEDDLNTPLYMDFGTDLFKYLPNVKVVAALFYGTYWNNPIPFNLFNKRYKVSDRYGYMPVQEDSELIRKKIKYVSYTYKQDITYISSCFNKTHFNAQKDGDKQANTFDINNIPTKDADGEVLINYYQFVDNENNPLETDREKHIIDKIIQCYTNEAGSEELYLYPSYEYTDTLKLHGAFYIGIFDKCGDTTESTYSPQQVLPLSGTINNYLNNLIVSPDLLYACTSNCTMDNVLSQDGITKDMLTGILPKHFYKNIKTINTASNYSAFKDCFVIPNYIGTYIETSGDIVKLRYNIYSFIPDDFTNSNMTDLKYAFNFKMHWPKQGIQIGNTYEYDFYVVSTTNSFDRNITSLNNAFPTSFVDGDKNVVNARNVNYNTLNRSIHFNLSCSYTTSTYNKENKEKIFGSLSHDNLTYIDTFNTGINMSIFTQLDVTNLITNINVLYGYFGYIFNQSYDISNMKLLNIDVKNMYCITLTNISEFQDYQLSCNIVFPKCTSVNETTKRLFNISIGNGKKFHTNTSMFGNKTNTEIYKNMYNTKFEFNNVTRPIYAGSE